MSLVTSDQSLIRKRTTSSRPKTVFYRLFGDIVEQLNEAVAECVAEGKSQATIAREADMDPATLSRILTGRAGTNLRSISCVLAATDHRLKVEIVSCKRLDQEADLRLAQKNSKGMIKLVLSQDGKTWKKPRKSKIIDRSDKQFSNIVFLESKDKVPA